MYGSACTKHYLMHKAGVKYKYLSRKVLVPSPQLDDMCDLILTSEEISVGLHSYSQIKPHPLPPPDSLLLFPS